MRDAFHRIGEVNDAGAHLGIGPVVGNVGRPVLERRRGDDRTVQFLEHRMRQRLGRIDPVAVEAGVGFAPEHLVDRKPFDEQRIGLLEEARDHLDPAADHQLAAPCERPGDRLDAPAVVS